MTGLKKIKGLILFVSLLYLTFYIPMTLTFYFPQWMELNCGWHNRCEQIGNERSIKGINELASYFRHQGELNSFLTQKEKLHLKEVRGIFDKMLILGLVSLVILLLAYNRKRMSRYALINAAIIVVLLIVLPFFGTFWRDVFHPLLFDNDLWMNNKYDLSFYIMPREFFKYTVALLIILCFSINIALWLGLRSKNK
jgi:integral membrane protein (TIGR01906 family)